MRTFSWTIKVISVYIYSCYWSRGHGLNIWILFGTKNYSFLEGFWCETSFRDKEEVGELAELHQNKENPTMGGLLICSTVVISVLLWAEPNVYVVAALSTYLLLTIVGFADDY